ncbi:hypothetical protein [Nonomuraea sp. SBT364]|uniref:hypothetical protein n=1 Tax=Nonomuraea sp. SBT364 TaxID=1580530 RepID=UPI00066E73D0|nr:hypothetical protein [Nonomuraea sp. SBT364]
MRKTIMMVAVLALAATATPARAAESEGKYWHTQTLFTMTHPRKVGIAPNTYWVVERQLSESTSALSGDRWVSFRELGANPKSAADRAAWKRDGSPASWRYRTEGMLVKLSTEPGKARVTKSKPSGFILGGRKMTYQELQALPSEPAALKERLVEIVLAAPEPPRREEIRLGHEYEGLLHELPVTEKVRAAAFTLLSAEPGTKVTDAGKNRKRLTTTDGKGDWRMRRSVTVDTSAMLLVGEKLDTWMDGKLFPNKTWTKVIESGWTDTAPTVTKG